MDNLSKRIVEYRAEKNMSALEFSKLCNLCTQTIYNIESGKKEPSRFTRAKIEKVLNSK